MEPLKKPRRMNRRAAFTLLELISVVAILLVLLTVSIRALRGPLEGRALTAGGDRVAGQLALARQSALSENTPVRWELIASADPRNGDAAAFRLMRLLRFDAQARAWQPLGAFVWLPAGVCAKEADSTLLSDPAPVSFALPDRPSQSGDAAVITFFPSGETSLSPVAIHSLTLHQPNRPAGGDFLTLQIDPVTGQTRFFRP